MAIADIEHVGFAVEDAARSLAELHRAGLFVPVMGEEDDGFRWVMGTALGRDAGIRIELLDPNRDAASPIARHLRKAGEGAQHVTFAVADLESTIARLSDAGVRPAQIDLSYAPWKEAFISPEEGLGVVVQLASSIYPYGGSDPRRQPHRRTGRNQLWWAENGTAAPAAVEPVAISHVEIQVEDLSFASFVFGDVLGGAETVHADSARSFRWPSGTVHTTAGQVGGVTSLDFASPATVQDDAFRIGRSRLVRSSR